MKTKFNIGNNTKQKVIFGLTAGAFLLAFVAIFMGFLKGIYAEYYIDDVLAGGGSAKYFDLIFNKDGIIKLCEGNSNAGFVVMFALTIVGILMVGTVLALNVFNKSSYKINKAMYVVSSVVLLLVFALALLGNDIAGIPFEHKWNDLYFTYLNKYRLKEGAICWSVLTFVAGGLMIAAASLNKKAFGKAK